jgi:protein transport protein SEC24
MLTVRTAGYEPSDRRSHLMRQIKSCSAQTLSLLLYPRIYSLIDLEPEHGFPNAETGHLVTPPSMRASFSRIAEGGAYLVHDGQTCLIWLHSQVSPNLLEDLFGEGMDSLGALPADLNQLPVLQTHLNAQVRNLLSYWGSIQGREAPPIQLARQGMDGAEYDFARLLVEDRNGEAQSYVDWLVHVHRGVQMELSGQRGKKDRDAAENEGAMAGLRAMGW